MRGFLVVLIVLIFGVTFPMAVLTYALGVMANPTYIKVQLTQSKIYEVAVDQVPKLIVNEEDNSELRGKDPIKEQLKKIVLAEVDKSYIQGKVEPFIDDIFSWVERKISQSPQISFTDLIKTVEKKLNQPVPAGLKEKFSQPVKLELKNAEAIKDVYGWFKIAPIIFGITSVLLLIGLLFLVKGWKAKLRRVALAIFLPTFFGFLGSGIGLLLGQVISGFISGFVSESPLPDLEGPLKQLIVNISQDFTKTLLIIYGLSLAVAAVLFIVSFFVERKKSKLDVAIDH